MKIILSAFADEAAKDFRGQLEALKDNNTAMEAGKKIGGEVWYALVFIIARTG